MSLFDTVSQAAGLSGTSLGGNPALMQGVLQLLGSGGSGGGLASLIQGFEQKGLGAIVSSWVGTGPSLPISPEQVQQGLGAGRIQQLAQAAGLTESATTSALAALLPTVVNQLTPGGVVPQASQLEPLVASLKTAVGA
jgi:uncharacterized protein YidB (DUF937 family)